MVHEQKFKDVLSSKCQVSVERVVLDLESEAMRGLGSIPTGGNIFSKFYNPNLHNIARSDRIGLNTKKPDWRNSITCAQQIHGKRFPAL